MAQYEEFKATYADLCSAWHAIASEYEIDNTSDPQSFGRKRTDAAFLRLLTISGWTMEEWNAQVAAEK